MLNNIILQDNNKFLFNNIEFTKEAFINLINSEAFYGILKRHNSEIIVQTDNSQLSAKQNINKPNVDYIPTQKIYFGAPGTGKSYKVTNDIKKIYPDYDANKGNSEFVFRTAIHPSFDYSTFIGSIKPIVQSNQNNGKEITYDFEPGIFTLALNKSFLKPKNQIFLVLEEMTRGNISEIFGDLFQLLDRNTNNNSEYAITNYLIAKYINTSLDCDSNLIKNNNIYIPNNFNIIGTINTSDQNVFVIDNAFRRRFEMCYVSTFPAKDANGKFINDYTIDLNESYSWIKLYMAINKFIIKNLKLKEDKQLGQFFLQFKKNKSGHNDESIKDWNYRQIRDKLLIYLWNDIQGASIFSEQKLFNKNIYSFEKLLENFDQKNEIFSEEFIDTYKEYNNENL